MRYSMFKFFRNLIPDNYVKGYLDGYTDAETEFLENADYAITAYNNGYKDGFGDRNLLSMSEEDLDVAYWQGYNNGAVDAPVRPVSENDDNRGGMQ